ncbi:hypothetical protein HJC23_011767 [Cyclotella cryptica]|uniref:DUF1995 domain-containing protein n=1 Tax=Cyclotella cryptica TaxID=29204 RepID=A0ABD3PH96_9STRA
MGTTLPSNNPTTMRILSISLLLLSTATSAFQVPSGTRTLRLPNRNDRLLPRRNIPTPTVEGGATPEEIKEAADKVAPPSSFYELQIASVRAAQDAIRDGYRLLEVEFPPLPASVLEMDDVSAYDVAKSNVNLALDFAKAFATTGSSGKVAVMLPDESECNIMLEDLKLDKNPYPNVLLTSLRRSEEGDTRIFKPENVLIGLLGRGSGGTVKPIENTKMYIVVVASAQELPDIEELYNQIKDVEEGSTGEPPVIVMYNLKLDVLRGDLGAPAFPGKDFQDRFLSRVKPVYYLRTRQYSRSTNKPPFILNYQGCLFRSYPGHFQTLLDTGTGRYRKVCGNDIRPALGEFKEQLTDALREEGAIPSKEEEGTLFGFLRTGYKTTTWWEEERADAGMEWRT